MEKMIYEIIYQYNIIKTVEDSLAHIYLSANQGHGEGIIFPLFIVMNDTGL